MSRYTSFSYCTEDRERQTAREAPPLRHELQKGLLLKGLLSKLFLTYGSRGGWIHAKPQTWSMVFIIYLYIKIYICAINALYQSPKIWKSSMLIITGQEYVVERNLSTLICNLERQPWPYSREPTTIRWEQWGLGIPLFTKWDYWLKSLSAY